MDNIELYIAIGGIVYGAASEIIGMSKLKQNSVLESVMSILGVIFGKKNKPGQKSKNV